MKKRIRKSGQVWIETVLYTLIAFAMIGIVLTYAKPKIQEIQDKKTIENSIQMLREINSIILSIKKAPGNQRAPEITLRKGTLEIDGENDLIIFKMESAYVYTEQGMDVETGGIIANTKKIGDTNEITLTSNYSEDYNLKYKGADESKLLNKASTPYQISISNEGGDVEGKTIININF